MNGTEHFVYYGGLETNVEVCLTGRRATRRIKKTSRRTQDVKTEKIELVEIAPANKDEIVLWKTKWVKMQDLCIIEE